MKSEKFAPQGIRNKTPKPGEEIGYITITNDSGSVVAGFKIKAKAIPGRYHSDPVKNAEAHEIIRKADELTNDIPKWNPCQVYVEGSSPVEFFKLRFPNLIIVEITKTEDPRKVWIKWEGLKESTSRNYGKAVGHSFDKTQNDYHGSYNR